MQICAGHNKKYLQYLTFRYLLTISHFSSSQYIKTRQRTSILDDR